jgi:SAM-dependent methyltransferase
MGLERFTPGPGSAGELHAQHLSRYDFAGRYIPGKRIIDAACGTGYGSSHLLQLGAGSVTGIDLSEEGIAYAKKHYISKGLTYIRGDVSNLQPAGRADCVVSFETIEHLDDPEAFLAAVRGALIPGGLFIVSTPVRRRGSLSDRPENPFHVREWNEEEFDHLLSGYFSVRQFFHQYVYRKRPWPFSRTINGFVMKLFPGSRSEGFGRFPVVDRPWDLPDLIVEEGYMIVVCSGGGE